MISWLLFLGHLSKITCDGQLMFIVRTPGNAITKAIVDVHCKLGSASWELSLCQFCWDEQTQLSNDRGFEVISCRIIGLMVLTMLIRIVIITMTVMVSHMWIVTSTSPSKLSTIFSASFKHFLAQLRFHHCLIAYQVVQAGLAYFLVHICGLSAWLSYLSYLNGDRRSMVKKAGFYGYLGICVNHDLFHIPVKM